MLSAGADPLVISRIPFGGRPIDFAARNGHRDVVNYLWSYASPEDQAKGLSSSQTPLCIAADCGHTRIVEDLLTWNGWSEDQKAEALIYAAAHWRFDAVTVLLRGNKFKPSIVKHALDAAMDEMAWGGPRPPTPEGFDYYNHQRLIELLFDTIKADTNEKSFNGFHLVRSAASNANLTGALKVLLEKGADTDRQDGVGYSALHILASPVPVGRWSSGRLAMNETAIELLLQHGASVTTPNKRGDSAIHLAASGSDLRSFRLFLSPSSSRDEDENTLLALKNTNQETLLHYAAAGCRVDIMEYLILRGLDVNAKNSNGWTPLMCALTPTSNSPLTYGKVNAINTPAEATHAALLLLSHGADPSITTDEGWTTLHALALHCDLDVRGKVAELATQLIARGVDPAARAPLLTPRATSDPKQLGMPWGHRLREAMMSPYARRMVMQPNLTPLHWSAQRGAVGVVKALLAAGVDTVVTDSSGVSAVGMAHDSKALAMRAEAADAIVYVLLGAGAASNIRPPGGYTR